MLRTFLIALAALLTTACAPMAGDACDSSQDCGTTMYCETSMPGGYCTLNECEHEQCPGEGICIRFRPQTSLCMQPCLEDGECREGYRCVKDFGVHPFCNDARGEALSK